jgi:hypothetical protein
MTNQPTNSAPTIDEEPFPLCKVCGEPFQRTKLRFLYCSAECRLAGAKGKQAEYTVRTGKTNGGGSARQKQIEELRRINPAAAPAKKFSGSQINHAEFFDPWCQALAKTGNAIDAAQMVTGNPRHGPGFISYALAHPERKKQYLEAAQVGGNIWNKQAYKLGVEGVDKAIVSGGEILGTEKVYSEKIVLAYARKNDSELVRANSAGGAGTQVNIQLNTGMTADADGEPQAIIKLSEVHRLSPEDRESLARIYAQILAVRENKPIPPNLNWSPDSEVVEGEAVAIDAEIPEEGI